MNLENYPLQHPNQSINKPTTQKVAFDYGDEKMLGRGWSSPLSRFSMANCTAGSATYALSSGMPKTVAKSSDSGALSRESKLPVDQSCTTVSSEA